MLETPIRAIDRELVASRSDRGNRTTVIASMYLFVLAGLCFLVFLAALRSRLLAAEGGTGELTALVTEPESCPSRCSAWPPRRAE